MTTVMMRTKAERDGDGEVEELPRVLGLKASAGLGTNATGSEAGERW